ncbi:unnamed protein product [Paramecium primaurelia]|uniref:Uncharacterized protein n=1 Tax=Paramecium primaurelia TaxID=5886 RepID=A0A8S1N2M4_PARPR|nr:unnamed protein product [Paramecium primaurelia]
MLCKFHFLLGNYHRMKCIQCQIYNHYNELNKLHRSYYLNNGLFCIMNNYWRKFHITSKMDRSFHILNHQDNIHFCKINNLCFLHLNNLHMDVHTAGNQMHDEQLQVQSQSQHISSTNLFQYLVITTTIIVNQLITKRAELAFINSIFTINTSL